MDSGRHESSPREETRAEGVVTQGWACFRADLSPGWRRWWHGPSFRGDADGKVQVLRPGSVRRPEGSVSLRVVGRRWSGTRSYGQPAGVRYWHVGWCDLERFAGGTVCRVELRGNGRYCPVGRPAWWRETGCRVSWAAGDWPWLV